MYKMQRLDVSQIGQAEDDILSWFRKHPDYEVGMCDIVFFAVPYLHKSDAAFLVHRLVKRGQLQRLKQRHNYITAYSYRLPKAA